MLPKGHDNPVYPQPLPEKGQTDQRQARHRGITLLDQLAIAALPVAQRRLEGLEASYQNRPAILRSGTIEQVAREAYDLAEAMLVEGQQRLAPPSTPSPTV